MNRRSFLQIAPAIAVLSGCGKSPGKIRLALNWKPDPQFGGFYAAPYPAHGLDVEILPGGAGTPTIQMIGAGSTEFGVVSADELVVARSQGNDVVALFAVFQNNPQGIMVHAERKLASLADLFKAGGTVALQRGLPYARLLEKKYGFEKVKIVPSPGGDISAFLADKNFAQQCFIMSEPLMAKHQGADVQVFPVSDAGYNPYTTVLSTSGDFLRKDPVRTKAMVAAVREGWRAYLDNPQPTNQRMNQLNPSMAPDTFAEVAEAQKPLIETDETRRNGLGAMTGNRWETLIAQLKGLGDIQKEPAATDCYRQLS
ncbi:MAG TPA: ABC transporter substrate-binding protein [Bryobacteraceae bacterium]|nr:ABC transporter substrate-binding protein [Bryobacteraceae bacterium]